MNYILINSANFSTVINMNSFAHHAIATATSLQSIAANASVASKDSTTTGNSGLLKYFFI
jgi:hypothetical protein